MELELDETEDLTTKWINLGDMEKVTTDMKSILTYYMYMNKNKR
ncbi:hypothetical protein [Psychrilyobacter sp.]